MLSRNKQESPLRSNPMSPIPEIPGAETVVAWFGGWPSFHDAEILEASFVRNDVSHLRVHFWITTDQVDSDGCFVRNKHAIVTFTFDGIKDMEVYGFNKQNVISGLAVEQVDSAFRLSLGHCYGLAGVIQAEKLSVGLKPGMPGTQT
jgi:hypothetical protein